MERERFSGFTPLQVDPISELLREKNIDFEVFVDQEEFAAYEQHWKETQHPASHASRGTPFDPHHISFDIATSDVARLLADEDCKARGFIRFETPPLDEFPAHEDFLCPKCTHHADAHGLCPVHSEPLLSFEAWNAARKLREESKSRSFLWTIAAVVFGLLLWHFAL
jgi:hypothetical protein